MSVLAIFFELYDTNNIKQTMSIREDFVLKVPLFSKFRFNEHYRLVKLGNIPIFKLAIVDAMVNYFNKAAYNQDLITEELLEIYSNKTKLNPIESVWSLQGLLKREFTYTSHCILECTNKGDGEFIYYQNVLMDRKDPFSPSLERYQQLLEEITKICIPLFICPVYFQDFISIHTLVNRYYMVPAMLKLENTFTKKTFIVHQLSSNLFVPTIIRE